MKFLKQKNISKFSISDNTLIANHYGRAVMDLTGGLRIPKGTTAQRPQLSNVRTPNGPNGYIRYNTLEPKNFKRIAARGNYGVAPDRFTTAVPRGSMSIATRDLNGNLYDVVSYDNVIGTPESNITQPSGAQDALGLRFTLYREPTNIALGPILTGYQLKAGQLEQ
jgi:hypothetical protein